MVNTLVPPPLTAIDTLLPMLACTKDMAAGVDVITLLPTPAVYAIVLINVLPPVVEVISLYNVPARVTVDRSPGYA